jgi:hypothetical protein
VTLDRALGDSSYYNITIFYKSHMATLRIEQFHTDALEEIPQSKIARNRNL